MIGATFDTGALIALERGVTSDPSDMQRLQGYFRAVAGVVEV